MINKLWTDVSLENYNNWYPLTGKITETPPQYIKTWPNVNDWFKTFAMRAQNDINAYLDFILSKFPFDSFKDELIKETLRDMVYVCVEHWVFNRTPIEFNVDATIQFNNGSQFSANSIPTINVWDLAPSRMKIWARLTELKQLFLSYNNDEIDIEKIDLQAFYTRTQVDELIKEQKEFTLSKQMKLYDDLVDDNVNEIYRGPVTNFINKGYVATEYDPKTETMILDWPDEIGTLPPEALQNNPQIGDFTHAPTCDFSAKQQKRITTNENNISNLNNELTKTNENINDIKNNWFNIKTSPLWKKMSSFIPSSEFGKTYLAIWGYIYQPPSTPTDNYIYSNKKTIFKLGGDIQRTTQKKIKLDELIVNNDTAIQLLYDNNDITVISNNPNYKSASVQLYQYQGNGIPTEFIAEAGTGHNYYTKQETNELLDKKQDKLIAGNNITIDENNKISATGGKVDLSDYYKKEEIDNKWLEDFPIDFNTNANYNEIENLQTEAKEIVPAINENKENIDKKQDKLIPNGNIEITEDNKIRAFDASFDNNKFLKKYSLYDSNTELNTSDLVMGTCGYINKWYQHKLISTEDIIIENNKISFTREFFVAIGNFIMHFQQFNDLTTVSKILINAINEINKKLLDFMLVQPIIKNEVWKEVGTIAGNNTSITYDFKINTLYRLSFSWIPININVSVIQYLNFYVLKEKPPFSVLQTFYQENNANLRLCISNNLIAILNNRDKKIDNCLYKLEELQE